MKKYDIVIIGGGASAMMCAAKLNTKKRVAIVEAGYSLGKKILVTGNGFLYNMVRTMTGELIDLALEKRTEESLALAFQTGERGLLGKTMPAKGLTLLQVDYTENERE